ncbi:FecR family protein [Tardiphaga sp. OK246]|uniref:cadherin-like domain-containing protein n=1 Tax=Tardiphaga sp. OK246 TaxID=1855307 RepID=UPI000B707CA2|nr:cadherin-like domain-containing protein [Tardiphaga sp. OK246]SNS54844.1 FecR family protein [Tardiphaga sp. OK246]
MNYAGPLEFSQSGDAPAEPTAGGGSIGHTFSAHTAGSAIVVQDANLLFSGDYKRSGVDLVLSKDGHEHVVSDYFKGSLRAALSSPDGAQLSGDLVTALVGEVQVAQLGGGANAAAQVIGTVSKLAGSATAIRNGVSVMLNVGDQVQKGDVVQAGADSSLTMTFIDGTVFGLSANARMVLNEMVYDPQGSANSSLLSLVQGTITFVAGETAKHGNMRVDTPVATMGIRGTAVLVEIGFEVPGQGGAPPVKFQVLVEPNGVTGSYVLYSKTSGQAIGTVNAAGQVTSVLGNGDTSTGIADPLTPIARAIIEQTLQTYFPNYVPNANPRSGPGGGSSPGDPNSGTSPDPLKFIIPDLLPNQPYTVPIKLQGDGSNTSPIDVTFTRFNTAPIVTVAPVVVMLPVDKTSFEIKDQVQITDPDSGDVATPYVPGTAHIISASGPSGTPTSLDLKSLITVDPQTGHVSYDPAAFKFLAAGQKAVYTIGFDSQSGPDTTHETLTFTVDGSNDAPVVLSALTAAASQDDGAQSFNLLAGASDADLGETATLTVGNVKFALNGGTAQQAAPTGVTLTGTTLHVDPSAFAYLGEGQTATITVTYNVIDAHGASVAQTETITVTGVNDQPTIVSTNFTVPQGGEVTLGATSFTISDPDVGSDLTFTVTNVSGGYFVVDPPPGQLLRFAGFRALSESQAITFTMADLQHGRVHFISDGRGPPSFDLQVDDRSGAPNSQSPTATQTVKFSDLAPVVDKPLTSAANEGDCAVTVDLLTGVNDPDGGTLSIDNVRYTIGNDDSSTDLPAGLSLNGTSLTYDPANKAFDHLAAGEKMIITVSYDIFDGQGGKTTQTETITVTGTNDRPAIKSASFALSEGGTTVLSATSIGIVDPDSHDFSFTVSQVRHGKFQIQTESGNWCDTTTFTSDDLDAGHVRFVHDGSESDASFSIRANDGQSEHNLSDTFRATIEIEHVNDAPKMLAAPLLIAEGATVVLTGLNFLVNDPDDNSFTFTVSDVEHGVFKIKQGNSWVETDHFTTADLKAGRVIFTHDGGEIPPSYTVTADDNHTDTPNHLSNPVDSTVVFIPVNDAPKIVNAHFSVDQGGSVLLHASNFGVCDPDSSSFKFTVSNVKGGHFETYNYSHGQWSWTTDTSFTTAELNADHVRFVQDGSNKTPTFSIKANDGSLFNSTSDAFSGGSTLTHPAPIANEDHILNAAVPSLGDGWLLNIDNGHYYRLVTTASSWSVAKATAQADGAYLATITSQSEQDFVGPLATGYRAWLGGVSHDDANGSGHFFWATGPEAGTPLNYAHWAPLEPNGGGGANTQYIHIEGVTDSQNLGWNDEPGFDNGRVFIEEVGGLPGQIAFREDTGTTLTAQQLLQNDTGLNQSSLSITAVSTTSVHGGSVTLADNIITYHPSANYNGADSFTYTLFDGTATSTGTVSFDVAPVNDAPMISTENLSFSQSQSGQITLIGISVADADSSNGNFTVTTATGWGHATPVGGNSESFAAINASLAQGVTYAPGNSAPPTTEKVSVTVTDSDGASDSVNFIVALSDSASIVLEGTSGKDVILATYLKDTLTGGAGKDQFVFANNQGQHTITDFKPDEDRIDLHMPNAPTTGSTLTAWLDAHATQVGNDTLIHLDAPDALVQTNTILLQDVVKSQLTANDFILHA